MLAVDLPIVVVDGLVIRVTGLAGTTMGGATTVAFKFEVEFRADEFRLLMEAREDVLGIRERNGNSAQNCG